MPLRTLHLLLCAPVPVGHRVEVSFYVGQERGPFGNMVQVNRPLEPIVVDLDAGVRYAAHWLLHQGGVNHDTVNVTTDKLRAGLQVAETVTGRVRQCQVVTVNSTGVSIETTLVIETEGGAYR